MFFYLISNDIMPSDVLLLKDVQKYASAYVLTNFTYRERTVIRRIEFNMDDTDMLHLILLHDNFHSKLCVGTTES